MALILDATRAIIETAKPQEIIMETFHSDLPPKAMKKYDLICGVLKELAYTMIEQFRDDKDHKDYWVFSRQD